MVKKIAVLTSGGDSPGMNAAIRAVVRTGIHYQLEIVGIQFGYRGLLRQKFLPLNLKSVGGIIQHGGTILMTSRSVKFKTKEGVKEAAFILRENNVDGLVIIGGDGSLAGALDLYQQENFPVVGLPATIDNDLYGTDMCLGVDTALNTIVSAIDKIKDTASSHRRAFLIEVMGRKSGYLALMSGIAGGVEAVIIPEYPTDIEELSVQLKKGYQRGKSHCIVLVAEGAGDIYQIGKLLETKIGFRMRVTILGHLQRGGSPSGFDRILGSRLGAEAVIQLLNHQDHHMVGLSGSEITTIPLAEVLANKKAIKKPIVELAAILAR
ncbi:MAG: 6-phosphofructokinase [Candidatus Atribacteria bacterium]|nr:6-phosphofructokinase [Candidatus Atribacteria bacterium]